MNHKDAVEEENPSKAVTPEWLEEIAADTPHPLPYPDFTHHPDECPACALKAAADALRAERGRRERAESERDTWKWSAKELSAAFQRAEAELKQLKHESASVPELINENCTQAQAIERLLDALEYIAESHDSGRHDGLPEPCPAHDDVTMWAVARDALSTTDTYRPKGDN